MTALLTILAGLARGLREGMIMHPDGVRAAAGFWAYHALDLAVLAAVAWLAVLIARKVPSALLLAGLAVLAWECSEAGYATARGLWGYEHIAFADVFSHTISGAAVYVLHGARIAAAGICIIAGRYN